MRTEPATAGPRSPRARLLLSEQMVLALAVGTAIVFGPTVPGFASRSNAGNLASNVLPLLVLAVGQTFVLIAGGIDLSLTATIALASVVGASIMTGDGGFLANSSLAVPAAIAAMLAVGLGVGLLNGLAIAGLGMPPFMVTLASMMAVGGLAVWYTESAKIDDLPDAFIDIEYGTIAGIPIGVPLIGAIALGAHVLLARTVFGRWLYAVGQNRKAARISGIPEGRAVATAYVLSGLGAGVASILYTARLMTGSPVVAPQILLDVVGACAIGGTSLFGGRGKVSWTAAGVLFVVLIDDGLNLMNLSYFTIMIVKGGVILLAAWLDAVRTRRIAMP